jgi:hypothetical protein
LQAELEEEGAQEKEEIMFELSQMRRQVLNLTDMMGNMKNTDAYLESLKVRAHALASHK